MSTSSSAYVFCLTQAAAEQKASMAASMLQFASAPEDPSALKELEFQSIKTQIVIEIAFNAAEALHARATVEAMSQPDHQSLQDRLAAAATLVVELSSMALESYERTNALQARKASMLMEGQVSPVITISPRFLVEAKSARLLCRSVMSAAEEVCKSSFVTESFSSPINTLSQRIQLKEKATQRSRNAMEVFTAPYVHEVVHLGQGVSISGFIPERHKMMACNDAVTAAREEALQASMLNRSRVIPSSEFLSEVSATIEDVRKELDQRPERMRSEVPHAPLLYQTGFARRTTEMALREAQNAVSSTSDDPKKPVRVMIAKSLMVAAMDVFTRIHEASAVADRPYLWQEKFKNERYSLDYYSSKLLQESVKNNPALTPDVKKIEEAIKTILPDSLDQEIATMTTRSELPEMPRRLEEQKNLLLTWRRAVSTPEERRRITATAQQAFPAIIRLENTAAQLIQGKMPHDLFWRSERMGAAWFSGGLRIIEAARTLGNLLMDAPDRAVMHSQHKTVFDAAAAAVPARMASKLILKITKDIVNLGIIGGEQLIHHYHDLQEAIGDAYAAAAEAMKAYDGYNTADIEAAKVGGIIKMTTSKRNQQFAARALQQVFQTMGPSIAPPPRAVMNVIAEAASRSQAAWKRAQEAAALIQPLIDAARAARMR